jgi:uncharacterized protein (TIGR03790 family)
MRSPAALLIALQLSLIAPLAYAGGGPENVLVMYAGDSTAAASVADHYRSLRSLPPGHLCPLAGIDQTRLSGIPFDEYDRVVRRPFDACLGALPNPSDIDYVVLVRGMPYRAGGVSLEAMLQIDHATRSADHVELANQPAVDGAILNPFFTWNFGAANGDFTLTNPYEAWYASTSSIARSVKLPPSFRRMSAPDASGIRFAGNLFIVTQLDGFDFQDAHDVITRGVMSDGSFPDAEVMCMAGGDAARGARDPECEFATRLLRGAGLPGVFVTPFDAQLSGHRVAAYFTGTDNLRGAIAGNTYVPGAITDNLTSNGADPSNFFCDMSGTVCPAAEDQTSIARFIRAGATGAHGAVNEPLNNVFPNAGTLLFYTFGYNLGESYFFNQRFLYWQNFYIGDPLATPYGKRPVVSIEGSNAVAMGSDLRARATHERGVAHMMLYDGNRRVAEQDGDSLTYTVTASVGTEHDFMAVAIARNATVARPTWPVPTAMPRPDIQGWTVVHLRVVAASPDAGETDTASSDAGGETGDAGGGARDGSPAGGKTSSAKGCGCSAIETKDPAQATVSIVLLAACFLWGMLRLSKRHGCDLRFTGSRNK